MISIKTKEEIGKMREAGGMLAKVLDTIKEMVVPGITTAELNNAAESLILKKGAVPAFKGYQNFPATLCTSVNETIVHGVPSSYKLKQGDIISLDIGLKYGGYFADMATTMPVGRVSPEASRLINVTREALRIGISMAKAGNRLGDLENAIQQYIEHQGYGVVRELCGHGIGRKLHEEPAVLNYGEKGSGIEIKEGMVICIEPMVTIGDWHIKKEKDGFGYKTRDNSLSAHFEHTVAVTGKGSEILTR